MDLIREGLRDVTSEGGTAGELFKGFPVAVAGKTGDCGKRYMAEIMAGLLRMHHYDKPQIVVVCSR